MEKMLLDAPNIGSAGLIRLHNRRFLFGSAREETRLIPLKAFFCQKVNQKIANKQSVALLGDLFWLFLLADQLC